MRVSRSQITDGVTGYIRNDILPKLDNDRAVQVILTIAVNAAAANSRLVDAVFDNGMVKAVLDDDGTGTYDISVLADSMKDAVMKYGSFPVKIPAVPLLSPREITVTLGAEDIEKLRRTIESA